MCNENTCNARKILYENNHFRIIIQNSSQENIEQLQYKIIYTIKIVK